MLVLTPLLAPSAVLAGNQRSDIADIHSSVREWQPVTEGTLDSIVQQSGWHFEGLAWGVPGTPPPTVGLFANYVRLADYYNAQWKEQSASLDETQQREAVSLAGGMFYGKFMLTGYSVSSRGFEKAVSQAYFEKKRVRKAPEAIREASQSYLLWRMSALRAENSRNFLGPWAIGDPNFTEAYERYGPHGEHFGYLSKRRFHVEAAMMAEAMVGMDRGKVKDDPFAAQGYLLTVRGELLLAYEKLCKGDEQGGSYLAYRAMKDLADARSFGALRSSVLDVFSVQNDEVGILLQNNQRFSIDGEERTFRDIVFDGIKAHREAAENGRGMNIESYLNLTPESPVAKTSVESSFNESVVVEAKPGTLNFKSHLYAEIELLAREAVGEDTLIPTLEFARMGKILFQDMARDIADRNYLELQTAYREAMGRQKATDIKYARQRFVLPAPSDPLLAESLAPKGRVRSEELQQSMTAYGSRLFAIPEIGRMLQTKRFGEELRERLHVPDHPELWVHLGDMYNNHARAATQRGELLDLLEGMDHRLDATYGYLQAITRYRDQTGTLDSVILREVKGLVRFDQGHASSLLHLNLGATSLNLHLGMVQAYELLQQKGLGSFGDMAAELGDGQIGIQRAERLGLYRERADELLRFAHTAYDTVRDWGPRGNLPEQAPPHQVDIAYARFTDSLAGLVRVNSERVDLYEVRGGNVGKAEKARGDALDLLENTPPANGGQLFSRGVIYADRLGMNERATRDLCNAYRLLVQEGNLTTAQRALDKARDLGLSCELLLGAVRYEPSRQTGFLVATACFIDSLRDRHERNRTRPRRPHSSTHTARLIFSVVCTL